MKRVQRIAPMAMAAMVLWWSATGCGAAKLKQCKGELAACQKTPKGQLLRTGQSTCYDGAGVGIPCAGTGQDGEFQKGLARTYVDNGDGTVTDTNTGLMWEKKSDDGSIHDQDDVYTWANALTVFIPALNGGGGFAGHTDWRLPNITELRSIAYGESPTAGCTNPAVDAVFNTNCTPGCTVTTCSCQWSPSSLYYWSSTTYTDPPGDNNAWALLFWCGGWTTVYPKTQAFCVRAVRGGS